MMSSPLHDDPYGVLGLNADAGTEQIRERYLTLVRENPPQNDAERFRQIQSAYESIRDPMAIAESLLKVPDDDDPPTFKDTIDRCEQHRPMMPLSVLLSLGNRSSAASTTDDAGDE